ncbi:hypothetical protein [Mucilaginibacter sp.]|uniref:hypothetical protein n=1 Tax=Mucilaginibacter sp. TaxID=1882438 RepID=UPI0032660D5F
MKKNTLIKFTLIIVLVLCILGYKLCWMGQVYYDSEGTNTKANSSLVFESGFNNSQVIVLIDDKPFISKTITTNESSNMATDFLSIPPNSKKIFIKSGLYHLEHNIDTKFSNLIIRKNLFGLRLIFTNQILSYD